MDKNVFFLMKLLHTGGEFEHIDHYEARDSEHMWLHSLIKLH